MEVAAQGGRVAGFTTNPTLMARAGVADYERFAREALRRVRGLPISFEVLADDLAGILRQGHTIGVWGPNVFIKVPVCTTASVSTTPVVRELAAAGHRVNVTAVLTLRQVEEVLSALPEGADAILSVVAGRIADTGRDPCPLVRQAADLCHARPGVSLLWASPRQILNLYQADACGADLIAITPELLARLALRGKDLEEFSRETVAMFVEDARRAGFTIPCGASRDHPSSQV